MEHFLELFITVILKVALPLIECTIKVIKGQKEKRCFNTQEAPALICPTPP